ncbi:MAG: cyclopropane-fatty-acyl-phospholipid synthase family protein [Pseudomonadota bacterium]
MFHKTLVNKLVKALEKITTGSIELTLPDNSKYNFYGNDEAHIVIEVLKWQALSNVAFKGDIGFVESYSDGLIEVSDIEKFFYIATKNIDVLGNFGNGNIIANCMAKILYNIRSNTILGSKKNIHAHYDLGNEFYSLWLDPSMTYSSAIFANDNEDLVNAQYNKYDRIIERLGIDNGKLLEVGCGWGGFAERATTKTNLDLKAITISDQQYNFAKQRLSGNAFISNEDYRLQDGKYDGLVSIEMFEAVGEKFWPIYFKKCKSLLKNTGKSIIQTITIDNNHFKYYRNHSDLIRTYIFPGGMLPSKERFTQETRKAGMHVSDMYSFGKDYAKTLKIWLEDFDKAIPKIKLMGFDEKFIRIWRCYLSACIAGFIVGKTDVIQAEICHA